VLSRNDETAMLKRFRHLVPAIVAVSSLRNNASPTCPIPLTQGPRLRSFPAGGSVAFHSIVEGLRVAITRLIVAAQRALPPQVARPRPAKCEEDTK